MLCGQQAVEREGIMDPEPPSRWPASASASSRSLGDGPWCVFLSHTSDLRAHPADRSYVAAAEAAVIRAGHALTDMAYLAARDASPEDYCTEMMEQADVYVGILGRRYGAAVPARPDLSFTELEFEAATELSLPRLVFLVGGDAAGPPQTAEHEARQGAFRRRVQDAGLTVAAVTSPAELEVGLLHALSELRRHGYPGRRGGRSPTPTPLQLPPDIADFTGRAREIEAVLGALSRRADAGRNVPVWVIAGKPGVGKSALAVRVAHLLGERYADAHLYVDLRGHQKDQRTPESVLAGFLQGLGCDHETVPSGVEQRAALYRSLLAGKRAIVVLDNARDEQQVRPLLPGGPACAVLVTSRRRLTALATAGLWDLDDMMADDAIELLRRIAGPERLRRRRRAAATIVDLCGRLPLGIRIAGAILRGKPHWGLDKLIGRLADERRRLDELRTGDLDVRASFALSYGDLSRAQARAFRLLSLLPGPDFSVPLAAAVLGQGPASTERLLEELHDAQLLLVSRAGRFRFHDLIRLFSHELLVRRHSAVARKAALGRALGWYLTNAEARARALRGAVATGSRDSMAWFDTERPGLIAAAAVAHEQGRWRLVTGLAEALQPFFAVHAHWTEQEVVQRLGLDAARELHDRHAEAVCLDHLGTFYRMTARVQESLDCHTRSLAIFRSLDEQSGEARSLNGLGGVYRAMGRLSEALGHNEESLAIYRRIGDRLGEARVLNSLGIVYANRGFLDEAAGLLRQSLETVHAMADRHFECNILINLGDLCCDLRRPAEALDCYRRAIAISRSLGDRSCESWALCGLGNVHRLEGRWEQAISACRRSLASVVAFGDRTGQARVLAIMGDTYRDWDRTGDAADCYARGHEVYRRLGMRRNEGILLRQLGLVRMRQGRGADALRALEQSLAIARQVGGLRDEIQSHLALADVHRSLSSPEAAATSARRAAALQEALDGMAAAGT
jgi:tetratricopeptide (TPR) repeat protein